MSTSSHPTNINDDLISLQQSLIKDFSDINKLLSDINKDITPIDTTPLTDPAILTGKFEDNCVSLSRITIELLAKLKATLVQNEGFFYKSIDAAAHYKTIQQIMAQGHESENLGVKSALTQITHLKTLITTDDIALFKKIANSIDDRITLVHIADYLEKSSPNSISKNKRALLNERLAPPLPERDITPSPSVASLTTPSIQNITKKAPSAHHAPNMATELLDKFVTGLLNKNYFDFTVALGNVTFTSANHEDKLKILERTLVKLATAKTQYSAVIDNKLSPTKSIEYAKTELLRANQKISALTAIKDNLLKSTVSKQSLLGQKRDASPTPTTDSKKRTIIKSR